MAKQTDRERIDEESPRHPHEPEIPPTYNDGGQCRICLMLCHIAEQQDEIDSVKRAAGVDSVDEVVRMLEQHGFSERDDTGKEKVQ